MGNAHFVNNQWNTIIYYNMSGYYEEFKHLRLCTKQINAICQDTGRANMSNQTCEAFLNQLQTQLKNMESLDTLIAMGNGDQLRKRRGLLNGGGYLLNELFGVLDQRDAAQIEDKIEDLNNKEMHILEMMKNQTSITEATIQNLKDHENAMNDHARLYDKHMEELVKQANAAHKELGQLKIDDATVTLALHATLMMIKYQQTQHIIIDMVTQTHHGRIHPSLFPPAKLIAEIKNIKAHAPQGTSIAELENGGLTNLYKLMGVKVRNTGKLIIFHVTLPLPNIEVYQVFHLIPVPIIHGNDAFIIHPSSTYLLVNIQRDRFYSITKEELYKCIKPSRKMFLCKPHHPIFTAKSIESKCEVDLLNHAAEKPDSCLVAKIELPIKQWTPLAHANNWIYVMSVEATIDVICEEEITAIKLQGQGILHIVPPCILRHEGTIITSQLNQYQSLVESFIPTTNFTIALPILTPEIELQLMEQNINNISQDWISLETRLTNHRVEIDSLMRTKLGRRDMHDIHHYSLLYILLAAVIIIIIALIVWCRRTNASIKRQTILPMQSTEAGGKFSVRDFVLSPSNH